jgi:hypothetical protein
VLVTHAIFNFVGLEELSLYINSDDEREGERMRVIYFRAHCAKASSGNYGLNSLFPLYLQIIICRREYIQSKDIGRYSFAR